MLTKHDHKAAGTKHWR